MLFIKILQKNLKLDLILQIMNQIDHCLKEKKGIGLIKDELGGKIMTKFVELKAKIYSYLIDDGSKDKNGKITKECLIKLKFQNYKNCLEATQLENKISHLEKNKVNVDTFFCCKFVRNNEIILQTEKI